MTNELILEIFLSHQKLFDEYASWLFSIFEVAERIELETEDAYHKSIWIYSEFLLLVWVTVKKLRVYECKVGMLGEKGRNR